MNKKEKIKKNNKILPSKTELKNNLQQYKKNMLWQLGYKPLKEKKDEDFVTTFKKTIRTRKSRSIEAEIENIMMELGLYNKSGEYAMHLNTQKDKNNANHYTTYWKIPRGLKIQHYMDKTQQFSDALVGQVIIEPRNGAMMIDVWEGVIPQKVIYNYQYINYMADYKLPVPIGKNQMGIYIWDLLKIIHVIIAGTTGGGKSILLTGWADALLQNPNVLLFVIDFAMTDFYHTKDHVVFGYDLDSAEIIIDYLKQEAEKRRIIFAKYAGTVNIEKYNKKYPHMKLPYLILFIDEFAFTTPAKYHSKSEKKRRQSLQAKVAEIAQIARKLGIHLIISTQKPSRQLFPEEITTHFPGRISFKTNDRGTSMTILGNTKAYYLPNIEGRLIAQFGNRQIEAQALYLDPEIAAERMSMFDKSEQYEKYCNYKGEDVYEWQNKLYEYKKKRLLPRSRN